MPPSPNPLPPQTSPGTSAPAWAPPPPARKGVPAWAIVLIVVVVVIAAVFATMVLFVLSSGLISSGGDQKPVVALSPVAAGATSYTTTVVAVSRSASLGLMRARLLYNGTMVAQLNPLSNGALGVLSFTDVDGDGKLSRDDRLTINQVTAGSYVLEVLWHDGSVIVAANWNV